MRSFHTPKSCPLLFRLALFLVSGFVGPTVGRLTCRGGKNPMRSFHTPKSCPLLLRLALFLVFGLCVWKWTTSGDILNANQDCSIGFGKSVSGIAQKLAFTRKIGNRRGSEGLRSFKNSNGTNLLILIVLAGDIEMNPGPRFQCRLCKKYCKAAGQVVECADCEKRFHASCANLGKEELLELESGSESWYCSNCKAECSLCSGLVLNCHKAVQCDKCDMWVHNDCSFLSDSQYETMQNTNCTWICPKWLVDIINDHGFDQLVHFPTRERNTLDLIITSLPNQFVDIHSPDCLSDHDIVSGTLKIVIPPIKKPRRKVYRYQKGDYESMRAETLKFAKEKYFNGYSDTRSVQENFNLITSFIQDSADKHIPSKTSRSVSSVPWITPEIRRKIRRKNITHAKAKKTGSAKIRSKFENLRREIKADIRKQHDLYVNNLVGDVKANPRDFYRYINSQRKDTQGISPLKKKIGSGIAQSDFEKAEEFNGQFTDVFTKTVHNQVPLLDRSAPFMDEIVVTNEGVTKLLKGLNPSKALGPDELHPRVLKELAKELGPVFAHLFQQSINTGEIPKEWSLANICPLFKKGDRSLACNYRPVSLTCIPCNFLEHIVCSNIMGHLDQYNLL